MCEEGDTKAKSLLQEHFGNPMKIAPAYMGKISAWPIMKSRRCKSPTSIQHFFETVQHTGRNQF